MNYRFRKFTTIYPSFVRQFLTDNPDHQYLSHQEPYDRFIRTRYGLSDFYAKHMQALGNEARDLFATLEPLQKAWAKENDVDLAEDTWLRDIVLAQAKAFRPDVLYLQDLYLFDQDFRQHVREACAKRIMIIGWRAAPTQDFTVSGDLDVILTAAPHMVQSLRQNGANAVQMPLAFEHTILDQVKPGAERDLYFTFVGSLGSRNGPHSQRYAMIEKVMPSTPLQVWGSISEPRSRSRKGRILHKVIYQGNKLLRGVRVSSGQRARIPLLRRGARWDSDPTLPSIKQRYPNRFHEPVFGLENYQVLARSKIAFNSH